MTNKVLFNDSNDINDWEHILNTSDLYYRDDDVIINSYTNDPVAVLILTEFKGENVAVGIESVKEDEWEGLKEVFKYII